MRLGVLDIGSNTGHLLVVDAYRGAAPMPASSYKEQLRLAEHLAEDGRVTESGVDALTEFVGHALTLAEDKGCAVRGTFVIDKQGTIRWAIVNALPEARDLRDYAKALEALSCLASP